jgi:hypothetical protein
MIPKQRREELDKYFTALKADVMISIKDEDERASKLDEIEKLKKQSYKNIEEELSSLETLYKIAKDYADALGVDVRVAIALLTLQEVKHVHWHMDEEHRH